MVSCLSAHAEVVLDGTLGTTGPLSGPDYQVSAAAGRQHGAGLFHSFSAFNLAAGESATFSGPPEIRYLVSRVTGGEPSNIDGTLRSTLAGADWYFFNPAGMMLGPHAALDVPGSLHLSSAAYLRLGERGRFDALAPERSVLAVEAPAAFGFVEPVAGIRKTGGRLSVPAGKTLSVMGGDLDFQESGTFLRAESGAINLVSVTSAGEVPINPENLQDRQRFGTIRITDDSPPLNANRNAGNLDVSGEPGGKIYIQGGQIVFDNVYIFSDTEYPENELSTAGKPLKGRDVIVNATDQLTLRGGTRITTETKNAEGGNMMIGANEIELSGGSQISSTGGSHGTSGNIRVDAENHIFMEGRQMLPIFINGKQQFFPSGILSSAYKKSGDIDVSTRHLEMSNDAAIRVETLGTGDAGQASIRVDRLSLYSGAQIQAGTGYPGFPDSNGKGGMIDVSASESIVISGRGSDSITSGLKNNVLSAGQGGVTRISAPVVEISDGGTIQTGTRGTGNAGNIVLENVGKLIIRQGGLITAETKENAGNAGDILITADTLRVETTGAISATSRAQGKGGDIKITAPLTIIQAQGKIEAAGHSQGNAGDIVLKSGRFYLHNATVETRAVAAGGGNIHITADDFAYGLDSEITASAGGAERADHSGNITLQADHLFVLHRTALDASAFGGDGGNIHITAGQFVRSGDSTLNVTSELGVDGQIGIEAAEADFSAMTLPPPPFLHPGEIRHCASRSVETISEFVQTPVFAAPPDDLSVMPWLEATEPHTAEMKP